MILPIPGDRLTNTGVEVLFRTKAESGRGAAGIQPPTWLAIWHRRVPDDAPREATELGDTLDAPVLLHPGDDVLWRMTHPDENFRAVSDGDTLTVGGTELCALHTPGHSPGSVCWYAPDLDAVFSGDTLFSGGPGATGRSFSDFPTILQSISGRLGKLPGDTVVYTGHGDTTSIGDEIIHYDEWVARGH